MHEFDIVSKINTNLDKIMENFIETLLIIKRKDNDMKGLFFAKRRIISIIEIVLEIYEGLKKLREINKMTEYKKTEEEEKNLFIQFLNNNL
ncbi:uncharacterized protein VNE69_01367 [Vairimorpha necatrix]|uniref:Uncharacterized protein n=1 Tax=Vairimorpha necatrix TaxID=6039 RepID=A0AAX4J8Y0_9MICR